MPLLLDDVLDDAALVEELLVRLAPYWNQAQYQPPTTTLAAAVTPAGHPFAMADGAPPLFRGNWADDEHRRPGVEPILSSPRLLAAAVELFDGVLARPSFLYVNVSAPSPAVDAGHVDVPAFRGLDRRTAPGWFLLAMSRSERFERWRVRTATAVVWFFRGDGGDLRYWPHGPHGPEVRVPARHNTALVGDNDRMFHAVDAVGSPAAWRSVPRSSTLSPADGSRWAIHDGGAELASFDRSELRVSQSWKAEVFLDADDVRRRDQHLDDLTLAHALHEMAASLTQRGLWAAGSEPDLDDPAFVSAVMTAHPRQVPAGA
jgi:hypothetical protein